MSLKVKKVSRQYVSMQLRLVGTSILAMAFYTSCQNSPTPNANAGQVAALFSQVSETETHDVNPEISGRINRLRQEPTTASVDLIRINQDATNRDEVNVPLVGVGVLAMKRTGGEVRGAQDFTWLGTLQGNEPGGTTLVIREGQVTGTVSSTKGVYRIVPVGGGMHALVKLDIAKFPADEPPSFDRKPSHPNGFKSRPTPTSDSGVVQIDVLVGYTPGAKAKISAVGDLDSTLRLAVEEANQSYLNSHVNLHLNLVDSFPVSYVEGTNSFDTILASFVANPDVKKHRDQSGADLQVLIINKPDYCGLADAILATESTAFAIVHYNCATGYYSFAHELGHLMGARHNEQADPTDQPFPYGHGYQNDSKWRTIMAYDCPQSCNRLQYWSNPDIKYSGEAMGTATRNNNARVLNETASTMASFRSRPH